MKKFTGICFCVVLILSAIVFASCTGGASLMESKADFKDLKDLQGKEWFLLEIRSQGKTIQLDRTKLDAAFSDSAFSLNFEEGRVNGMGAPNRYFAPYTAGGNNALSIGTVASTMMAALFEPEELKERDYFDYLSNVSRWDLSSGKLELYSANSTGAQTVLVFEGR